MSSIVFFFLVSAATDFTLKTSDCPDTEYPVKIVNSERGCLWYKKDNKFKIPKGELGLAGQFMKVKQKRSPKTRRSVLVQVQ